MKAGGKKRTIIWKNSSMPINQATQIAKQNHGEDKTTIWKCATVLRNEILSLKSSPLNEGWSAENIIKGEVDIPENLQNFYKILYTGSESGPCSSRKTRLTNSSSADAIFACSGGKLIPGKHLSLGLALKSMTGSKSVVSLLNRFGHCIGDETVRRMDMSFEEAVNQNDTILPSHIQISPNLSTGLAWDNFDINIETSGANTIHHTYGICYQNIMPSENSQSDFDIETNSFVNMQVERKFKKVPTESKQEHLEPYHKKPKLSNFVTIEFTLYQPCPNYKKLKMQDYIWATSFNMFDKIPM